MTNQNHLAEWTVDPDFISNYNPNKTPVVSLNWKEGFKDTILNQFPDTQLKEIFIMDDNGNYHSIFKDNRFPDLKSVPSQTFKIK